MTAEVCIMNRIGIAIAADSAVTLSSTKGEKIYASVDKMFNLSNEAPVGIMVYGGASFLGLVWETIVKEYRQRQAGKSFDKLSQYADSFLLFLTEKEVFPDETQNQFASTVIHSYFGFLADRIRERLNEEAHSQEGLNEEDISPIVTDQLKIELSRLLEYERLESFDSNSIPKVRQKYLKLITEKRKSIFENLSLERTAVRCLNRIGIELLTRRRFGSLKSGIVIAGFGSKEYYPRLYSFEIEGRVLGKLRLVKKHTAELSDDHAASVIPFAQQEMVHTFMRGIDPSIFQYLIQTTSESMRGIIKKIGNELDSILPEYNSEIAPVVEHASDELLKSMFDKWEEKQDEYWMPVVDIAASLPKDELASMAEALVNLTKFRRRVSTDPETVSGPIDVAVITRGDGFVWVKRKHYFDAELNPRIMARYLREAMHEQNWK